MIQVGREWQITRSDGLLIHLDIEQFVMPDPGLPDRLAGVASQEDPKSDRGDRITKRMGIPTLFKLRGEVARTRLRWSSPW